MSCYLIYYKDGAKMMRPINTREEYIRLRNLSPALPKREGVKPTAEEISKWKKSLKQMCYSCIPETSPNLPEGEGFLKGCTTPSTSVGMDVDRPSILPQKGGNGYLGDTEEEWMKNVVEKILAKKDELGLLMLERSATKGYHIVFKRKAELSQEENLRWASDLLGVEFDKGAKDITRVFFTTTASEEDLLYLDDELFETSPCPSQGETSPQPSPRSALATLGLSKKEREMIMASSHGLNYLGIPYASIIRKYWEMFNDGNEPCEGNRNMLTYELAMTLRGICDYDEELMMRVIPRYDNFSEEEWRKTIQNAIGEPRKGMPYRLRQVLKAVKEELKMKTISCEDGETMDVNDLISSMPQRPQRMPAFLSLVSSKVPMKYKAMVEESIWPALCAHLHGVTFRYVDGVIHEANICSPLIARQSSGKGRINEPIEYLLADISARDLDNEARLKDWRRRNQGKGASKDRQPRPEDVCIQRLDDDLTPAALAQSLIDADVNGGKRIITKVDEIEMLNKVGNGRNDTVALLVRYGFDSQRFGQRRVGLDSVNGSYTVRWVWNASCTLKSARKFFNSDWVANGSLSRLNVNALLLDKDDHELPKIGMYDERFADALHPYIERLNAANGLIECPQADKVALEMIDEHNRIADLCESEGYRTYAYRAVLMGWLKAYILYIMNGYKWNWVIGDYARYSVRRDMFLKMYFFGQQIEEEFEEEERQTHSGPRNMLELLPKEFTEEQYLEIRRQQGKRGDGKGTLRVWKSRGYIEFDEVTELWIKRNT